MWKGGTCGVGAGRPLELKSALFDCDQVTDALAVAHSVGLFTAISSPVTSWLHPRVQVKVLDFGLASFLMKLRRPPAVFTAPS